MMRSVMAAMLIALAGLGLARSAHATAILPQASDYAVMESCAAGNGCVGTFSVSNNSTAYYIAGFFVTNPNPSNAGTTQLNWASSYGSVCDLTGTVCGTGFVYTNNNGFSTVPADLANDIGPGQSSDLFSFDSTLAASTVTLDLMNSGGSTYTLTFSNTDVPEPASLALLASGVLGLAGLRRRGRLGAR